MSSNAHKKNACFENKRGVSVEVKNNDIDYALKVLKRLVLNEGLLNDMRDKEYYVKPGDRRRRDKQKAINRMKILNEKKENY